MLYVRTESISRHLNRQMDFVYELLLSLFMFVMYVNHSCMDLTKSKHTITIIIIYIISYDIYSILICQYHSYLMTLLTNFRSPKCAAITGVGVDMSPHCFIKGPNGSASYTASGSKV